jgi:16S rRNA C1402 (ribose-2'-O) methylase RsmI
MIRYDEHQGRQTPGCWKLVRARCLVSDAGTPGIADPGADLVRGAGAGPRHHQPAGPSAVAAALAGSRLPADKFSFLGYLRGGRPIGCASSQPGG